MHKNLIRLGRGQNLSTADFGTKAVNLVKALDANLMVAPGFCMSVNLVRALDAGFVSSKDLGQLEVFFNETLEQSPIRKIIVRSSSTHEDNIQHNFSGLFSSINGISTFNQFLTSVRQCLLSAGSNKLEPYFKKFSIDSTIPHLALIAQAEMQYEISGVLGISDTETYFEISASSLDKNLSGVESPQTLITFNRELTKVTGEFGVRKNGSHSKIEKALLGKSQEFRSLQDQFEGNYVSELALCRGKLYCFQIRAHIPATISRQYVQIFGKRKGKEGVDIPYQSRFGLKGAATSYFIKQHLFTKPIVFIPPYTSFKKIAAAIDDAQFTSGEITIRHSYGNDIGLPRDFVSSKKEAKERVLQRRKDEWTTLVHNFIDVQASFEMLVTEGETIVEHIPGMWESDNHLLPDVIILKRGSDMATACKVTSPRDAKFVDKSTWTYRQKPPVPDDTIHEWSRRAQETASLIRRDMKRALPLIVHFVADELGNWQFLNIRHGFDVSQRSDAREPFHVVRTLKDLEEWDGVQSILVQATTERGMEGQLIALAERLPKNGVPVYVSFGLLSHPAMVLQEYDINVVPIYLAARLHEYQETTFSLDIDSDPHTRILKERPLLENSTVHIVRDRNPIVPSHTLLLHRDPIASLADSGKVTNCIQLLETADFNELFSDKGWSIWERGRAKFCTSGFTNSQAHAHIVDLLDIKDGAISSLAQELRAMRFSSLNDAFLAAQKEMGEYLIFGSIESGFYLKTHFDVCNARKRFIRNYLVLNKN